MINLNDIIHGTRVHKTIDNVAIVGAESYSYKLLLDSIDRYGHPFFYIDGEKGNKKALVGWLITDKGRFEFFYVLGDLSNPESHELQSESNRYKGFIPFDVPNAATMKILEQHVRDTLNQWIHDNVTVG